MSSEASIQVSHPCSSCPWLKSGDRTVCFDPSVLRKTVVDCMQKGGIHPCHSNKENMCAGYLAFAEQRLGGAHKLQMVRICERLGMFDYSKITKLDVFPSINAMYMDHKKRLKR